ncbi:MAG TPA: helix-turn-helix transcriptional regulator [Candidatus Binatia bacterium]|nr:helix-turn-helix transcriptional regulator [Candidatus Binatia bacterium]
MSTAPDLARQRPPFAELLRAWRSSRKLSQLDLALASRISQRHLSFLESGRARPSREMVLQLAEALDVPLRERNALLNAAGFAALYRHSSLDDPVMRPVREALELLLRHHEPNPAAVVDREWNLVTGNAALHRVFSLAGDLQAMWRRTCGDGPRNVLRLMFHPQGFRPWIVNFEEAGLVVLNRTRREAAASGNTALHALLDEVLAYPGIPAAWRLPQLAPAPPPVLPFALARDGLRLNLFSMISTFGTPQDVTTDELRVESFFPADAASAELLAALAAGA